MHLYIIGFTDWEQAPYTVLQHVDLFTEDRLRKIVDAIWVRKLEERDVERGSEVAEFGSSRVRTVYREVIEELFRYGFLPIEYAATYSTSGDYRKENLIE